MPRQIRIDEDVYQFLIQNIAEFGEDESSVLRRLLNLNGSDGHDSRTGTAEDKSQRSTLVAFLESGDFRLARNATDRFLAILGHAHAHDPEGFAKVLQLSGTRRRYFARSRQEIERFGKATHPQPIPNSEYWALTNADTTQKRELLRRALTGLAYSEPDIRAATRALD